MLVVLDTNVLVSAVLSPAGRPAWIVGLALSGNFKLCCDHRIVEEYRSVLLRPKFRLNQVFVDAFLDGLLAEAIFVIPSPIDDDFTDESNRKFLEVARFCQAKLITGNLKHYPDDPLVTSVGDFCDSVFKL